MLNIVEQWFERRIKTPKPALDPCFRLKLSFGKAL
jgi:hypothetical protein